MLTYSYQAIRFDTGEILHERASTWRCEQNFYVSPSSQWVGHSVGGLYSSLRSVLLCGNNLDRTRGILENQRHGDRCACAISGRYWGIGVQEWKIAGGRFPRNVAPSLPIRWVACRGMAVNEWNIAVGGGVGVAPVIGRYFEFGCFGTASWPGQHCHCRKLPGQCGSIHYPFCGFHRELCPAIGLGVCDWG